MTTSRPYRSVLFMPGSNARALEKAKTLSADALVFDLEDAVAPDAKAEARQFATAALASDAYGSKTLMLRINGVDTKWWREDVVAAAKAGAKALVIPKVEDIETLSVVQGAFAAAGGGDVALWAMVETPLGVLRAHDVARYRGGLAGLIFGANDLAKDLHARRVKGRAPLLHAMAQTLLAARAYGLLALDSVYNDFQDNDGFEAECQQARDMGFDGKTLIHPNQIGTANTVFAPTETEIENAQQLVQAFEDAKTSGKGVAVLDGKMIEELHVVEARRILTLAQSMGVN